jgi:hypothetical protein
MDDELVIRSDNPLGNSAFLDESPFASYVSPFTFHPSRSRPLLHFPRQCVCHSGYFCSLIL